MTQEKLISIIDDDASLRAALVGLVRSLGHRANEYASAEAFLAEGGGDSACIVTDIQMPGMSGIDLKQRLGAQGIAPPVIMITGRAELHDKAKASGAFCVLRKPFAAEALIECLERALAGGARSG